MIMHVAYRDCQKSLIDEIWKRSGLSYLSDLVNTKNNSIVFCAVKQIPRDSFSPKQWEKAYEYLFRELGAGKTKDDILRGVNRG